MTSIKLKNGRVEINEHGNVLEIIIPVKTNYFAAAFMFIWLFGWAAAEFVIPITFGKLDVYVLATLVAWTAGGLFVLYFFLWNIWGQERVTVKEDTMTIAYRIFGKGRQREYFLSWVKNLRLNEYAFEEPTYFSYHNGGRRRGFLEPRTIKFNYGSKTIRFAHDIQEAEAKLILRRLHSRGLA